MTDAAILAAMTDGTLLSSMPVEHAEARSRAVGTRWLRPMPGSLALSSIDSRWRPAAEITTTRTVRTKPNPRRSRASRPAPDRRQGSMTIDDSRRVLVIGINYRPELTGIGPYTSGLVEHLAARGDQVTVIAGLPHYPDWRLGRGTERVLVREEVSERVRIIRAAHYVPASQDAMRRAVYEATFGLTALLSSYRLDRPDAILAIVPTLSSGVLARLLGRRFATRYGLLFQDLMGPAASQSGMAGGALVARATALAERWSAAGAAAIGVVSTSFVPYITSLGIPPHADRPRAELEPGSPGRRSPSRPCGHGSVGRTGRQVVLHAGNIGLKQGLDQIVSAARLAARPGRPGPVRPVGRRQPGRGDRIRAAASGLDNIQTSRTATRRVHASLLAAADVLLVSERASRRT